MVSKRNGIVVAVIFAILLISGLIFYNSQLSRTGHPNQDLAKNKEQKEEPFQRVEPIKESDLIKTNKISKRILTYDNEETTIQYFNENGLIKKEIENTKYFGPLIRNYKYDANNKLLEEICTSKDGKATRILYKYNNGLLMIKTVFAEEGRPGETTGYFYDSQNRLVKKVEKEYITEYSYGKHGLLDIEKTSEQNTTGETYPGNNISAITYHYNNKGWVTAYDSTTSFGDQNVNVSYDDAGRVIKTVKSSSVMGNEIEVSIKNYYNEMGLIEKTETIKNDGNLSVCNYEYF